MEKWYSKFRRGDVWYLSLPTEKGDNIKNSSVERKSRPYLIVSCEENNLNAPTFNVVPITTRNSDHLPMHVFFVYQDGTASGRNQMVLCEQITTVGVQVFNDTRSYFMYSFNAEFMNKVDEALARQLGLRPRVADMSVLERIVQDLAAKKEKELEAQKDKEVNMRVEKLAEMLAQKFNLNLTTADMLNGTEYRPEELQLADKETVQQMRATATERRAEPIGGTIDELAELADAAGITKKQLLAEVYHLASPDHLPKLRELAKSKNLPTPQEPVETTTTKVEPAKPVTTTDSSATTMPPRNKRGRWTPELKKEFLEDYKTMPVAALATKYDIKKSTVSYNVCVFRKEVEGK